MDQFQIKGLFENKNLSLQIYNIIKNKKIIEIGGPSNNNNFIKKMYELCSKITVINFEEINNMSITSGASTDNNISKIEMINTNNYDEFIEKNKGTYDILLTSHVIEHQANPIKMIKLWKRLLNNNGIIISILPNKDFCFDYSRPVTKLSKLIDKYNKNVSEDDVSEIPLMLKYYKSNPSKLLEFKTHPNMTVDEFLNYILFFYNNPEELELKRPIHHYVYDLNLLKELSHYLEMEQIIEFTNYIDHWVFWK